MKQPAVLPLTNKQIRTEQELTNRFLEGVPHAFFTTRENHTFVLEKGEYKNLSLTSNLLTEEMLREMASPTLMSEVERLYLSLHQPGYHCISLLLALPGHDAYEWYDFRFQVTALQKGRFSASGLIINTDQHIQKQMRAETAKNEEIEAKSKEMFLNNLGTEIRSPLNIILGFSELLTNDAFTLTPEERMEYSQIIYKNSLVLTTLVNEILDLSRIESGRLQFSMKECLVEDLLLKMEEKWGSLVMGPVKFRKSEGRKGIKVLADQPRLEQILNEFLSNAVQYTQEGEIVLGWNYSLSTKMVELFVEDTGCGISPERLQELQDPTHGMARMENGTNHLGLAISQVIAKSMNIDISIQSAVGKGSRFSLFIPECE